MEERHIVQLTDEDTGETKDYVYMVTLTKGDHEYAVLEPDDTEDAEEIEVLIFELSEPDEDDSCELLPIEDEALIDELFDEYLAIVEEAEEEEEDEEE